MAERKNEATVNSGQMSSFTYPTNIGIVRGTVSVATIVVVSDGVDF